MNKEKALHSRMHFKKEFAKLIDSMSIPSNLSDKETIEGYSELFSFVINETDISS